jgi:hypothetical protein
MTRIRATCPTCGEVDLLPEDIELCIVGNDDEDVRDGSTYRFDCPDCESVVTKPADARIARLLTSGGVAVTYQADPYIEEQVARARLVLDHPEGIPVGPPLTSDDLIDFHLLLQTDDWFSALTTLTA